MSAKSNFGRSTASNGSNALNAPTSQEAAMFNAAASQLGADQLAAAAMLMMQPGMSGMGSPVFPGMLPAPGTVTMPSVTNSTGCSTSSKGSTNHGGSAQATAEANATQLAAASLLGLGNPMLNPMMWPGMLVPGMSGFGPIPNSHPQPSSNGQQTKLSAHPVKQPKSQLHHKSVAPSTSTATNGMLPSSSGATNGSTSVDMPFSCDPSSMFNAFLQSTMLGSGAVRPSSSNKGLDSAYASMLGSMSNSQASERHRASTANLVTDSSSKKFPSNNRSKEQHNQMRTQIDKPAQPQQQAATPGDFAQMLACINAMDPKALVGVNPNALFGIQPLPSTTSSPKITNPTGNTGMINGASAGSRKQPTTSYNDGPSLANSGTGSMTSNQGATGTHGHGKPNITGVEDINALAELALTDPQAMLALLQKMQVAGESQTAQSKRSQQSGATASNADQRKDSKSQSNRSTPPSSTSEPISSLDFSIDSVITAATGRGNSPHLSTIYGRGASGRPESRGSTASSASTTSSFQQQDTTNGNISSGNRGGKGQQNGMPYSYPRKNPKPTKAIGGRQAPTSDQAIFDQLLQANLASTSNCSSLKSNAESSDQRPSGQSGNSISMNGSTKPKPSSSMDGLQLQGLTSDEMMQAAAFQHAMLSAFGADGSAFDPTQLFGSTGLIGTKQGGNTSNKSRFQQMHQQLQHQQEQQHQHQQRQKQQQQQQQDLLNSALLQGIQQSLLNQARHSGDSPVPQSDKSVAKSKSSYSDSPITEMKPVATPTEDKDSLDDTIDAVIRSQNPDKSRQQRQNKVKPSNQGSRKQTINSLASMIEIVHEPSPTNSVAAIDVKPENNSVSTKLEPNLPSNIQGIGGDGPIFVDVPLDLSKASSDSTPNSASSQANLMSDSEDGTSRHQKRSYRGSDHNNCEPPAKSSKQCVDAQDAVRAKEELFADALLQANLGWRRETIIEQFSNDGVVGRVIYYSPSGKRITNQTELAKYMERNGDSLRSSGITHRHFSFNSKLFIGEFIQFDTMGSSGAQLQDQPGTNISRYSADQVKQALIQLRPLLATLGPETPKHQSTNNPRRADSSTSFTSGATEGSRATGNNISNSNNMSTTSRSRNDGPDRSLKHGSGNLLLPPSNQSANTRLSSNGSSCSATPFSSVSPSPGFQASSTSITGHDPTTKSPSPADASRRKGRPVKSEATLAAEMQIAMLNCAAQKGVGYPGTSSSGGAFPTMSVTDYGGMFGALPPSYFKSESGASTSDKVWWLKRLEREMQSSVEQQGKLLQSCGNSSSLSSLMPTQDDILAATQILQGLRSPRDDAASLAQLYFMADLEREWNRQQQQNILLGNLYKFEDANQRQAEAHKMQQAMLEPTEDMDVRNAKALPKLDSLVEELVPSQAFADCLMTLEFINNFAHVLRIDLKNVPLLDELQWGLLNTDEKSQRWVFKLTKILVTLVLEYPGLPNGAQGKTVLGQNLREISVTPLNISEMLRMFLQSRDEEGKQLGAHLSYYTFLALSPIMKSAILAFLCNELLYCRNVVREIETNVDIQAKLKGDKWAMEAKLRQAKMVYAGCTRGAIDNDTEISDTTVNGSNVKTDDGVEIKKEPGSVAEEQKSEIDVMQKELNDMNDKITSSTLKIRSLPYGQDRYRRTYWPKLPHAFRTKANSRKRRQNQDCNKNNNNTLSKVNNDDTNKSINNNLGCNANVDLPSTEASSEDVVMLVEPVESGAADLGIYPSANPYRLPVEFDEKSVSELPEIPDWSVNKMKRQNCHLTTRRHVDDAELCLADVLNAVVKSVDQGITLKDGYNKSIPNRNHEFHTGWGVVRSGDQLSSLSGSLAHFGIRERCLDQVIIRQHPSVAKQFSPNRSPSCKPKPEITVNHTEAQSERDNTYRSPATLPDMAVDRNLSRQTVELVRSLEQKAIRSKITDSSWQPAPPTFRNEARFMTATSLIEETKCRLVDLEKHIHPTYLKPPLVPESSDRVDTASNCDVDSPLCDLRRDSVSSTISSDPSPTSKLNSSTNKDCANGSATNDTPANGLPNKTAAMFETPILGKDSIFPEINPADSATHLPSTDPQIGVITSELKRWRDTVLDSTTSAQLAICFAYLVHHIQFSPGSGILGKSGETAGLLGSMGIEDDEDTVYCQLCGGAEHESQLLLCDGCDAGYHIYCFVPPISAIPEGNWYCPICTTAKTGGKELPDKSNENTSELSAIENGNSNSSSCSASSSSSYLPKYNTHRNTFEGCMLCSQPTAPQTSKSLNSDLIRVHCRQCERQFHTNCLKEMFDLQVSEDADSIKLSSLAYQSGHAERWGKLDCFSHWLKSSSNKAPSKTKSSKVIAKAFSKSFVCLCCFARWQRQRDGNPSSALATSLDETNGNDENERSASASSNSENTSSSSLDGNSPATAKKSKLASNGVMVGPGLMPFKKPKQLRRPFGSRKRRGAKSGTERFPTGSDPNTDADVTSGCLAVPAVSKSLIRDESNFDSSDEAKSCSRPASITSSLSSTLGGEDSRQSSCSPATMLGNGTVSGVQGSEPKVGRADGKMSKPKSLSAQILKTAKSRGRPALKQAIPADPRNVCANMETKISNILEELKTHKDSWPFMNPVDTNAFPEYLDVIETPMDLSTITEKLNTKKYEHSIATGKDFITDINLIFSNCTAFNEDSSPVAKAAASLKRCFKRRWNQIIVSTTHPAGFVPPKGIPQPLIPSDVPDKNLDVDSEVVNVIASEVKKDIGPVDGNI